MKSQRIIKQTIKTEKLPQGQPPSINNKNYNTSNVSTVKETTVVKRYKRTFNTAGGSTTINKTENVVTSNLKQGTNSGYKIQNKIPVSNKEEKKMIITKTYNSTRSNASNSSTSSRRYTKKETDKIIKIQRWWKRKLAILNGYKIRESLRLKYRKNNGVKSYKRTLENYSSTQNINAPQNNIISSTKNYSTLNNVKSSSKSYKDINNIKSTTYNYKINSSTNTISNVTSLKKNYIQTVDKRIITQSPRIAQSGSTSPSMKSKYVIETKKVEVFRKPNDYSSTKFVKKMNTSGMSSMSNYEVRQLMKDIWNNETYCSTVESLCCLGDYSRSNISKNSILLEEYEEEIRNLKNSLFKKENELNNLMTNLKETKKELNVNITKNIKLKNNYNMQNLDQDAHELQIISYKTGWNDVNIPAPVNEIYIESIENKMPPRMQFLEGMQIIGKEESVIDSLTDSEAVLEIQEMNALSIISNKVKYKNICQHLQSLMILSKRNEESEEYSIKEKEEKIKSIEVIPVEKEPLIFQKIEQINITSRKPKPRKQRNQIQELDGVEIINYKRHKKPSKYRLIPDSIDSINLRSLVRRKEMSIQELNGLEILKPIKIPNTPQCVDELEISREYDMLLVKPTWNSLQIQGSGLNLLAIPRDMGLENQEVDEFKILGMEKPELIIDSLDKINYRGLKPEIKIVERKFVPKITKSELQIKVKEKKIIKKVCSVDNFFIIRNFKKIVGEINWNNLLKPIKTTKLTVKDNGRKFRGPLNIANSGLEIEGNKETILKQGPAQTIHINKEQILIPSQIYQINLISKEKPKSQLKSIKENKLFIRGIQRKEKEKRIEMQRNNSISLIGTGEKVVQIKNVDAKKDWTNLLHAQRNAKFSLYGITKTKKIQLLVANGDKFYIQKESEDEIIYNDDYNCRPNEIQGEARNQIIREKEYIPRLQREIKAQISKVKESESETSSTISEIDVLAAIKNRKIVGYSGDADAAQIKYQKTGDFSGYKTKYINGEVIFTAKNGLGVNLGGAQYRKELNRVGYTKKFDTISCTSNKISGLEIVNPNAQGEIIYQKMIGASGAIADGKYKIVDTKKIFNKSLAGSMSCGQMKVEITNSNVSRPEIDLINNGQYQTYKKEVIITSKTESNDQNINGSLNSNVQINNTRTIDSKKSNNSKTSKKSGNNGNVVQKRGSQNSSRNSKKSKESPKIVNNEVTKVKAEISRVKTESSQNSEKSNKIPKTQSQNKTISTKYEVKIKTKEENNGKIITETKKTTEINIKK